ncbi:MAG: M24 family metallopeptidase, partial [Clostridia bacterium]|nr:M24 family metallopeptidase [Clostridia bacterium]
MVTVKTAEEIELMREPCRIVKETLEYVEKHIHAGMTTKEVDDLVYKYITLNGAIPSELGYCGYPASSCVSVNEVVVHGIPGDRVLEDGDIVSVDITAAKNGFQGDACRNFLIGNVSPEKKRLVEVTKECFFKAI